MPALVPNKVLSPAVAEPAAGAGGIPMAALAPNKVVAPAVTEPAAAKDWYKAADCFDFALASLRSVRSSTPSTPVAEVRPNTLRSGLLEGTAGMLKEDAAEAGVEEVKGDGPEGGWMEAPSVGDAEVGEG